MREETAWGRHWKIRHHNTYPKPVDICIKILNSRSTTSGSKISTSRWKCKIINPKLTPNNCLVKCLVTPRARQLEIAVSKRRTREIFENPPRMVTWQEVNIGNHSNLTCSLRHAEQTNLSCLVLEIVLAYNLFQ